MNIEQIKPLALMESQHSCAGCKNYSVEQTESQITVK